MTLNAWTGYPDPPTTGTQAMTQQVHTTTPKPFAKLFEHEKLGQILVRRGSDDDEDKPGVRLTFDPCVDELAPCDIFIGVGGIDEDAAEKAADTLFGNMTADIAAGMVKKQVEQIQKMFCDTNREEPHQ